MRHILLVRHGEYDQKTLSLIPDGRQAILNTATKIEKLAGTARYHILSSTAPRAMESSQIIAEVLSCQIEGHDILWSESSREWDTVKALELVKASAETNVEVLVIVTHLEYIENLPRLLAQEFLGKQIGGAVELAKGSACYFDLESKDANYL